jgi:phosphoribosylformimino-5-aminoimidazole carboxamide ribonucleotide (ProFAR) isomerase
VLGTGRPVVAAGGITTVADLHAAAAVGAEAAIVGRAALEGRLDLAEAIASFEA